MPAVDTFLMSRRSVIKAVVAVAGVVAASPAIAMAQQSTGNQPGTGPAGPVNPPTTTTSPPRDFTAPSVYFGDPDILAIDPAFGDISFFNETAARVIHTVSLRTPR